MMAAAQEFGQIIAVLSELVPDADIRGIELRRGSGAWPIVTVKTRTTARLVGDHGATAAAVRAALADRFGDDQLQLNIAEMLDDPPPDERPPDGPGVMYSP